MNENGENIEWSFPPHTKENDKRKCLSISRNLLELIPDIRNGARPSLVLKELDQSCRCDHIVDFHTIRNDIARKIGDAGVLRRTMANEQTDADERIIEEALVHYRYWIIRNLRTSLPLWEQVVRTIRDKAAVIGGFVATMVSLGAVDKYTWSTRMYYTNWRGRTCAPPPISKTSSDTATRNTEG